MEIESVAVVGIVFDVELVEEVGECMDTLEVVSLAFEDAGTFASTLACVFSVHAEGGGFEVGSDSTKARKGIGLGPSIFFTWRESCLPRFMLLLLDGQDKARDVEESLSSLSEADGARGVVKTISVCRQFLGMS